ncbi:hypothetical protein ACH4SP_42385 [Streptomyces sp. NPDC021093]|uniref:hypothetical protein n=1 Tax=Streptomyces sp. NPDC021093 TaxID=3365112 RepID=UPI0037A7AAB9
MSDHNPEGHYDECPALESPSKQCLCAGITAEAKAYYAEDDNKIAQQLSWRQPL